MSASSSMMLVKGVPDGNLQKSTGLPGKKHFKAKREGGRPRVLNNHFFAGGGRGGKKKKKRLPRPLPEKKKNQKREVGGGIAVAIFISFSLKKTPMGPDPWPPEEGDREGSPSGNRTWAFRF